MHGSRTTLLLAAAIAGWSSPSLAAVWDGNGDPNASGDWSVGVNWDTDAEPAAGETATLGDVTSGERIVEILASTNAIAQLQMVQTTAGGTNRLDLNTIDADLLFDGSVDPLSLTPTAGAGSVVLNLAGGDIDVASANGRTATLDGTVNLSNGSRMLLRNSGSAASYTIDGAVNFDNAFGSTGLRVDNGQGSYTVSATGSLSVTGGVTNIGRLSSGSSNRGQTLTNNGAVTIDNGSRLTVRAAQSFEIATYNNASTTNVGSATTAGQAVLEAFTLSGSSGGNGRVINADGGELNVYGSSFIDLGNRSDAGIHADLQNQAGGTITFYADATGAGVRSTFGGNDIVRGRVLNDGDLTVTNHATAARGLGLLTHSGGAARWDVINRDGGNILVDDTADLEIATSNSRSGTKTLSLDNQSGGAVVLGRNAVDATTGSTLSLAARGGSDTATNATVSVSNAGVMQLLGSSRLELASDSVMTAWSLTNATGGSLELDHASGIGNTDTTLTLTNAGTITKTGAPVSTIASAASGSFNSTGLVDVDAGTLSVLVDTVFDTGGEFEVGIDGAASGLLDVTGSFTLNGSNTLSVDGVLTAPSYTIIAASSGVFGTFDDVSDVTSQGYTVVYDANSVSLVVPEPASMALVGLGSLLMLRRSRR